ncbi:hypothetical protein MOUN0_O02982 [Monosporozyma unispora]
MFKSVKGVLWKQKTPLLWGVGATGVTVVGLRIRQQQLQRQQYGIAELRRTEREYTKSHDLLKPDPQGDTFEMGLYIASKKEWDQQQMAERKSILDQCSSSFTRSLTQLKFTCNDHIWIPLQTMIRFIQLTCLVMLPILMAWPLISLSNGYKLSWYKLIRSLCQFAGPSFIKLGQWASARNDLFPPEFCQVLSTLHSEVKPHSWRYTHRVLCDLFKTKDLNDIFEELDVEPLGCGSIAQVHKAKWKSEHAGDLQNDIAIKILHPNVVRTIDTDLRIMSTLAHLIDCIPTMEWLSLRDEVNNFSILMNMQLDLRIEAMNLDKFNSDFQRNPLVTFPKPALQYTTRTILFEEYIEALPMQWFLKEKDQLNEIDNLKVSHPFVMAFLNMMILNNFVHSDLHPGNVMIRFIDKTTCKVNNSITTLLRQEHGTPNFTKTLKEVIHSYTPQICLIDVGLVTELNDNNRINFMDLFQSLTKFDGYRAGQLMIERSRTPQTAIDPDGFSNRVQGLVLEIKKQTFSLGSISIGNLLNDMLSMVRTHHVRMEADFVSIVVAILLLEGIGRQLDPNLDLFESSIPLLSQYYRHRYSLLKDKKEDASLLHDTRPSQMTVIWLGLQMRKMLNVSLRQTDIMLKSDQLSPNY